MSRALRSSLAGRVAVGPADPTQLDAMRRAAWRDQGVVMFRPDDIEPRHPWLAQAARNWAIEQFGTRRTDK
jgi:hypothetical protein